MATRSAIVVKSKLGRSGRVLKTTGSCCSGRVSRSMCRCDATTTHFRPSRLCCCFAAPARKRPAACPTDGSVTASCFGLPGTGKNNENTRRTSFVVFFFSDFRCSSTTHSVFGFHSYSLCTFFMIVSLSQAEHTSEKIHSIALSLED